MGNAKALNHRKNTVERSTDAIEQFMQKNPNYLFWSAIGFVSIALVYIFLSYTVESDPSSSGRSQVQAGQLTDQAASIEVIASQEAMLQEEAEAAVAKNELQNLEPVILRPMILRITVQPGDNLGKILRAQGFSASEIHDIAQVIKKADGHVTIFPGEVFEFYKDGKTDLVTHFSTETPQHETLTISRGEEGFSLSLEAKTTTSTENYRTGDIMNSLFVDGSKAGLSDRTIMELAQIFQWEVDFALDIRQGDHFKVIYEDIYLDDEKLRTGPILAAEFTNRGRQLRGYRYLHKDGSIGYYNETGQSLKKAFLKTPVDFARISSRFSLARKHPVLHRIRAHKGVDYAAPRGTPIKATGRGRIKFAGTMGGYGRTIIIQHNAQHSTLYAHMTNFGKNIKQGSRVFQGQVIGTIGSTGLATGPHLHYEFRLNDRQVDPLKVKFPQADSLSGADKTAFLQQIAKHKAALDNNGLEKANSL